MWSLEVPFYIFLIFGVSRLPSFLLYDHWKLNFLYLQWNWFSDKPRCKNNMIFSPFPFPRLPKNLLHVRFDLLEALYCYWLYYIHFSDCLSHFCWLVNSSHSHILPWKKIIIQYFFCKSNLREKKVNFCFWKEWKEQKRIL